MSSIFREVDKALLYVKDEVRVKALTRINEYLKSGVWEKKKGGSKPVLDTLGMKQSQACEKLGMKPSAYKVMMKRASDHIKSIIGSNIVGNIQYGNTDEVQSAIIQFNMRVNAMLPERYLINEINKSIEGVAQRDYNIADLDREIEFLHKHTKGYIEEQLSGHDEDKINFIIKVLSTTDENYTLLRARLFEKIVMTNRNNAKLLKKE